MSTITITLPESLQNFVTKQVADQGLAAPEEYFEKLLEADRQRKIDEYHWELVQEGLASGPPIPIDENFWKEIREEIKQRRKTGQQNPRV